MKKLVSVFVLFLFFTSAKAQEFDFTYNHYSCIVKDLKTVGDFYADVLKLEEIQHPSAKEGFRWFKIQGDTQLHLIGKDSVAMKHSKSVHLCLSTPKLPELIEHLNKLNVTFSDWPGKIGAVTNRADGVKQIYIQDPENNWVEINDAGQLK